MLKGMKLRMLSALVLTCGLTASRPASAQTRTVNDDGVKVQARRALAMEQQGDFEQALKIFARLANAKGIDAAEAGRIQNYLGYAQQEEGDFGNARASYKQAIRIFQNNPSEASDEAASLDNLADLDRAMGDLKAARRLERESLHLFENAGDHGGAAWALTHMAVIELTRKRQNEAEEYLSSAAEEARKAPELGKNFQVSLYSTKGWLADLQGDTSEAIFDYSQAIALEPRKDSVIAGWEYVLLGRAYSDDGRLAVALSEMQKGLTILGDTVGKHSRQYLAAEIAYARTLDSLGEHAESAEIKNSAATELNLLCGECSSYRKALLTGN